MYPGSIIPLNSSFCFPDLQGDTITLLHKNCEETRGSNIRWHINDESRLPAQVNCVTLTYQRAFPVL